VAAACLAPSAWALTYSTTNLQMMLCFRQLNAPNSYDLEVNLGSLTNYLAIPVGNTVTLTQYTTAQLTNAIGSTFDNVEFSVTASAHYGQPPSTSYPSETAWVTYKRSNPAVQSTPFSRPLESSLALSGEQIVGIGDNANLYSGAHSLDPISNTSTAVEIPPANSQSCENNVGPGNTSKLHSTFTVQVGNRAPSPFASAIVSDFYQDIPTTYPDPLNNNVTSGPASYLGYFTFNQNGSMTFTRAAASTTPAAPPRVTLSIGRTGTASTISFVSSNSVTYKLFFTNSAGLTTPVSNWPSLSGTISGNGGTTNFQDVTSDAVRIYRVQEY
jgi:hypothetical protein